MVAVRSLLVAGVEPFVTYASQMPVPFYVMFCIGIWLNVFKMRSVYPKRRTKRR
jgi:hypothetical protein